MMDAQTATTRRNLAQRIERFLKKRQADATPLSGSESANVSAALDALDNGRFPDGEDAMMLAEKDWPPRGDVGAAVGVEVLAERLARLLG